VPIEKNASAQTEPSLPRPPPSSRPLKKIPPTSLNIKPPKFKKQTKGPSMQQQFHQHHHHSATEIKEKLLQALDRDYNVSKLEWSSGHWRAQCVAATAVE